jgi:aryl-alcohol dehydrogenase-like predicted oxidoreductase
LLLASKRGIIDDLTRSLLRQVSAIGLGCMGLAGWYKDGDIIPEDNAVKLVHHAFNKGVTFFDTADVYGPHTNEILVGKVSQIFESGVLR